LICSLCCFAEELNRALNNKQPWSGYTSAIHPVTADNIAFGGGRNVFDLDNGHRDEYRKSGASNKARAAAAKAGGAFSLNVFPI
jgi:hypothetical protein